MSAVQLVVAPTAVVFDLLLTCEDDSADDKVQSGFSLPADVEPDCSGDRVLTEKTKPKLHNDDERQQQKETTRNWTTSLADVVCDAPPRHLADQQDSEQSFHSLGVSRGCMALMSGAVTDHLEYACFLSEQELDYSSSNVSSNGLALDQQQYTDNDVRTLAQCINEAAAKLEATSTNRVVLNMTSLFGVPNPVQDLYSLFFRSLDSAVAEFSLDTQMQMAFVMQVGRSLIAQCRKSSQLIRSYMKKYAEWRFGCRLKAQITRKELVSRDETAI